MNYNLNNWGGKCAFTRSTVCTYTCVCGWWVGEMCLFGKRGYVDMYVCAFVCMWMLFDITKALTVNRLKTRQWFSEKTTQNVRHAHLECTVCTQWLSKRWLTCHSEVGPLHTHITPEGCKQCNYNNGEWAFSSTRIYDHLAFRPKGKT